MIFKNFYLLFSFVFIGLLSLLPSAWFIYFRKEYLYFIIGVSAIFQLIPVILKKELFISVSSRLNNFIIIILIFYCLTFMLFFPIQNLNLGDGILLLEHVALESKIFGYHLTMDEILEALIHSTIFANNQNSFATPMEVYRLVSTISGLAAVLVLLYYFRKFKISFVGYALLFSSGGMYLYHGYSENYTIITLVLWIYILFGFDLIRANTNKNMKALLPICAIASFLILLHLVSGYLIFSLIFLCYYFSEKGSFIKNATYSTLFSLFILVPVFGYFTFFSDVRFDFSQTHLTNPKFYPISKIISTVHFRDIIFCLIGSCLPATILLSYAIAFDFTRLKMLFKRSEFKFLGFVIIGFLIHGFVHYPQLGFPADWDLLAFFWSPITFLSVFVWEEIYRKKSESKELLSLPFVGLLVFSLTIFTLNAVNLNYPTLEKIAELKISMSRIDRFSKTEQAGQIKNIHPNHKKFYLSVSFFLYESKDKIEEKKQDSVSEALLQENIKFYHELEEHKNNIDSKWQKDFYKRLTKYHLGYLDFINKK